MRKIISGKVYNTETAEFLGGDHNGFPRNDFRWVFEGLYKTKKGRFFIEGDGGPMSKYAQSSGDGITGSTDLYLISAEEAMEWGEEHMSISDYEEAFGVCEEG